jgi:sulfide dehydrogenase cytochrome subunit
MKNFGIHLISRQAMVRHAAAVALGLLAVSGAQAQNPDALKLYQRGLAATCASCHGTDGQGVVGAGMPLINHLSSAEILKKMTDYKSGAVTGTIMHQLAKGYTDEQLQTIASVLGKK